MPVWIDTRGKSVLSVAVCTRCSKKLAYSDLYQDPNYPAFWVCKEDLDEFDPWRLPALQTENIALRHPRPDTPLGGVRVTTQNSIATQGQPNGSPNGAPLGAASEGQVPLSNTQQDSLFIDDPLGNTYGGAPGIISL